MTRTSAVLHAVALGAIAILWNNVDLLLDLARPAVLGRELDWLRKDQGEMRHPEDRAALTEWGHGG